MNYIPIVSKGNSVISATALVGAYSVILGFDFLGPKETREEKFLGFAVHRTDRTEESADWLRGQLRFKWDRADFGEDVPTNRGPLQKFHWGDYTTKPGHEYVCRIHPVFGPAIDSSKDMQLGDPLEISFKAASPDDGRLGFYFNRGVTAAPAYLQRFRDRAPKDVPDGAAYAWLSRGLKEALLDFIEQAEVGDELKVAIYEFEHESVIDALKDAKKKGVHITIVYHAKPNDKQTRQNRICVGKLNLPAKQAIPRKKVTHISHNKFIVLKRKGSDRAEQVWTGSTNFTEAGLFLQTNVGIVCREQTIVEAFEDYFDILAQDLESDAMKAATERLVQTMRSSPPAGQTLFFSPVKGKELIDVTVALIEKAKDAIFISCPFGLDGAIIRALNANQQRILEYGLVNTTNRAKLKKVLKRDVNSWFASPAYLKEFDARLWDAKAYGNHKIHVKSLVTDPWGPNPRVLLGSANFSDESVNKNDENALLIEGDKRGVGIATTEFMRMFDHYKFRDFMKRTEKKVEHRNLDGTGSWTRKYYSPQSSSLRDREVFAGRVTP
jgi:phosphatidylserine/phosphatidylglycerophosphate/cardiolipin synthase-like enzyme